MRKLAILFCISMSVIACQKFGRPDFGPQISKHGEDESHNKGQNCMNCHYSEGQDAEGVFSLGGSMYGNTQNADVELYATSSSAEPFITIEVDQLGNAYTTEEIDYGTGIYVAVRSQNGDLEFMEDPIFNGQCNLCHGTNVEEIIEID